LRLLNVLEEIFIPQKVIEEAGCIILPLKNIKIIFINETEIKETKEILKEFILHPGELHALHLARKLNVLFLTDDLEARDAAISQNIEVHGTLGVVILAYKRGLIDKEEAKKSIQQLYWNSSLFLTPFIVEEALRLLE